MLNKMENGIIIVHEPNANNFDLKYCNEKIDAIFNKSLITTSLMEIK